MSFRPHLVVPTIALMPPRFSSLWVKRSMFKVDFRVLLFVPRDSNKVYLVYNAVEIKHKKRLLFILLLEINVQNRWNFGAVLWAIGGIGDHPGMEQWWWALDLQGLLGIESIIRSNRFISFVSLFCAAGDFLCHSALFYMFSFDYFWSTKFCIKFWLYWKIAGVRSRKKW